MHPTSPCLSLCNVLGGGSSMFTLAGRWIWWRATVLMLAGVVALLPSGTASAVPSACFADLHRAGLTAARTAEAGTGVGRRIVETSTVVVRAPWGGEFSSNDGGYTWVPVPFSKSGPCSYLHLPYEWEDTVHTPRGIYSIEDTGIVLTSGLPRGSLLHEIPPGSCQ